MLFRAPTPASDPALILGNGTTPGNGVRVGARLSVALSEIKRRLEAELPPLIEYVNAHRTLSGVRTIRQFAEGGYGIAPADLTAAHVNHCLVGLPQQNFSTNGSVSFKAMGVLTVYVTNLPLKGNPDQLLANADRASLVQLLLANYLTDCVDPQGRQAWKTLAPLSSELFPDEWREVSGVALNYQCIQPPGVDLWAV